MVDWPQTCQQQQWKPKDRDMVNSRFWEKIKIKTEHLDCCFCPWGKLDKLYEKIVFRYWTTDRAELWSLKEKKQIRKLCNLASCLEALPQVQCKEEESKQSTHLLSWGERERREGSQGSWDFRGREPDMRGLWGERSRTLQRASLVSMDEY